MINPGARNKKITIEKGDILIFTSPGFISYEAFKRLNKNIKDAIDPNNDIKILLLEDGIELSKEVIEQIAGDVDVSVDYYNEVGRGPVENPLVYQMAEQERGYKRNTGRC